MGKRKKSVSIEVEGLEKFVRVANKGKKGKCYQVGRKPRLPT